MGDKSNASIIINPPILLVAPPGGVLNLKVKQEGKVIHIVAPINDFESKHSLSSALCGKAFPLSKRSPTLVGANKVFNGSILLGTLERANMDANGGTMCTGTLLNKVGTSSYFGAGGVRESVLAYPTLTPVQL
ncbi:hypothetical protein T492DRAFT_845536 [Pavlovales sp. CCMP2436]|nr:hypothetical protein T492DRAFT_845536 [Pavlovales sp. CCMP2436]